MKHLPVFLTPNHVNDDISVSNESNNWIDSILILTNGEDAIMSDDSMANSDPDLSDGNWWISPSYYDLNDNMPYSDPIEILYLENISEFHI